MKPPKTTSGTASICLKNVCVCARACVYMLNNAPKTKYIRVNCNVPLTWCETITYIGAGGATCRLYLVNCATFWNSNKLRVVCDCEC